MTGKEKKWISIYILLEAILLGIVVLMQTSLPESLYTKPQYCAILLNFLTMLYFFRKHHRKGDGFFLWSIPLDLLLTLAADTFLVAINNYYIFGIIFFCCVQTVYAIDLGITKKNLTARVILLLLLIFFVAKTDLELIFSSYSMANLVVNAVVSILRYTKHKTKAGLLFMIGLILFLGCDISVGLRNAFALSDSAVYLFTFYLVWSFYIPSQVLIVLAYIQRLIVKGKKAL